MRDDSEISRVLAIAAHPDDLDFGAAGTIALWTARGIDVVYCIFTDGDAGGFDEAFPRAECAQPVRLPGTVTDEGLAAWIVGEVWIAGSPAPDHYVDVTDTFPRKLAALRAHESQTGHLTDLDARLRGRLADSAERAGLDDGRLAEAFQILETS